MRRDIREDTVETEYREYLPQLRGGKATQEFFAALRLKNCQVEIHYDSSRFGSETPLHSHVFYEVLFCCEGGTEYLLGAGRYRVQKGDVVLIPPGVSHRPLPPREGSVHYCRYALWLNEDFFEGVCGRYPELSFAFQQCEKRGNYLLRSTPATWNGLLGAFEMIYKESREKKLGWELCVSALSLNLMVHIGRTYYYQDAATPDAETQTVIDGMFAYIDTHLTEKLTLEQISREFAVSQSTVTHLFRKRMGVSFYQCVIQRRLVSAKNAMLQGMPLRQVWENSGFADYTSFYRLFKKEYGLAPREFRRLYQSQGAALPAGREAL